MKNTKELRTILASIAVLNRTSEKSNAEITSLVEYAFHRCFESNTNLLMLATIGQSYESMRQQVNDLLRVETRYHKEMGGDL